MIDSNLLRQLGWSDDLIEAVTRVAKPIRHSETAIQNIYTPHTVSYTVGAKSLYAESVINNTLHSYRVDESTINN